LLLHLVTHLNEVDEREIRDRVGVRLAESLKLREHAGEVALVLAQAGR
jgi:hypothetical protein